MNIGKCNFYSFAIYLEEKAQSHTLIHMKKCSMLYIRTHTHTHRHHVCTVYALHTHTDCIKKKKKKEIVLLCEKHMKIQSFQNNKKKKT